MHTVIVEQTDNGYSAYVLEVPGCVAAAETQEETVALIREALQLHLAEMQTPQYDLKLVQTQISSTVLVTSYPSTLTVHPEGVLQPWKPNTHSSVITHRLPAAS